MSATVAPSTAVDGHRAIVVAALLATFMQAATISLPNAALLYIEGSLSMADDEVGWIFTSYLAASIITMTMARWLAGRYGRKAVYQISIVTFIHVRSNHADGLPVIITHGWPGSVIEQLKVVDPLTNPTGFGGSAANAFDVVIPSLPGYGFSGKPTTTGWDPQRIARAWAVLMNRLGYTRHVAQGGDWGNAITEQMALQQRPGLIAVHTNMPATVPEDIAKTLPGGPLPSGLSADEKYAWDQLDFFYTHGLGYAQEMANRPQTLYDLADSPIGLAVWMLDHDDRSRALITRAFDGQSEGLTRQDVVENITLYWLTITAVSSTRLYWESKLAFFAPKGVPFPVAVSAYPDEIYTAPRSWAEKAYPKLIYYNRLPKGGHFAAWEQPKLFSAELRTAFRPLHTPA